jgi:hypothetical protein
MNTKEVLTTLQDNADNIQSYTTVEGNVHTSFNNIGNNIGPSLGIFSDWPQSRLDDVRVIVVSWKGKATQGRNALKEIEGLKLTSIDNTGQNPQDIITPS